MRYIRIISLVVFALVTSCGSSHASWMLEGHAWSSPYQEGAIYLSQLTVKLEPRKEVQATISLPIQYTHGSNSKELHLLYPRMALAFSIPLDEVYSSVFRANYDLESRSFQMHGGLHMLFDPLAIGCGLSYREKTLVLDGTVIFAVNERWALGAHLQYTRNARLTYELHHTSRNGKKRQFSYSHVLDGSLQSLGVKIAL
ncbi:MAG TPA: hypothetical protein GXZ85_05780 [Firmicutes bacterium]|nr:hypothetical protein [Bacillota bacterium]